jgi:hypothetical protein
VIELVDLLAGAGSWRWLLGAGGLIAMDLKRFGTLGIADEDVR